MMFDAYHLIYAKNGKSLMAEDFGPVCVWSDLREYSIKALEADDKDGFLVSVSTNLKMCSMDVCLLSSQRHIDDALAGQCAVMILLNASTGRCPYLYLTQMN